MAKHEYVLGTGSELKVKIFSEAYSSDDDLSDFENKINTFLNQKADHEIVSLETSHHYNGDNHRARRSVAVTVVYKAKSG